MRVNEGECQQINFTNLLNPSPVDGQQPATRAASVHITGMELVTGIGDDASNVGVNGTSLAQPGDTASYTYYAVKEETYTFHSAGVMTGGEGNNATITAGLFGAVNVQNSLAEYYRSQVTEDDIS